MVQTEVVEKIKVNFMVNNILKENRAVYEIMWRNSVEPDTTDDKYGARTVRQFV
jgi:formylglycine-generating enzyme required for sulfatase activity